MKIKKSDAAYYSAYYRQLKNAVIKDVYLEEDDSNYLVHIVVILSDGKTIDLELCNDSEGNSTGFLFGLPYPSDVDPNEFD
jgi:hypothetical protein